MTQDTRHFDLLTIGGGSGGVAVSNRAGRYGAKCVLIERARLGGTCVNVGCVPKKVMWNAAQLAHAFEDALDYGFVIGSHELRWAELKRQRDQFVLDLNAGYARGLAGNAVEVIHSHARFVGPKTVEVDGERISAEHVVIATGGGTFVDPVNRAVIQADGCSIWLDISFNEIVSRLPSDGRRPLAANRSQMEALYLARREAYQHAHVRIEATGQPVEALVDVLIDRLAS
jgi:pyruvate/2-oxoglutarate dehydrogenase complex dihydrolipoamide dehydrogenase (E3) component